MQHRLSISLLEAVTANKKTPTRATAKRLDEATREVCVFLDAISDRSRVAGEAARGKSGRQKVPFDLAEAQKMREEGTSIAVIAEKFGVSASTVRNRLASKH